MTARASTTTKKTAAAKKTAATQTPATASVPKVKRGEHLPLHSRLRRQANRVAVVNAKLVRCTHRDAVQAQVWLGEALTLLEKAATKVEGLPADALAATRTGNGRKGKWVPAEGDKVKVREARRGEYEGLITATEMDSLVVDGVRKGKVACRASSGQKLFFKPAELEVLPSAA